MSDTKKNALEFFKSNPNAKEVHGTTDGFVFLKKIDAINHAKTLNPDSPDVETIENTPEESGNTEKGLKDLTVAELKEKAVELKLPEADWKSLKKDDLVKYLTEKTEPTE